MVIRCTTRMGVFSLFEFTILAIADRELKFATNSEKEFLLDAATTAGYGDKRSIQLMGRMEAVLVCSIVSSIPPALVQQSDGAIRFAACASKKDKLGDVVLVVHWWAGSCVSHISRNTSSPTDNAATRIVQF